MKIHASARFTGNEMKFHNEIEIDIREEQIQHNTEKLVSLVLSKFKAKCDDHFKLIWADMCFFEVYYFSYKNEIQIFKKEKVWQL
jgi:hypothetical protein